MVTSQNYNGSAGESGFPPSMTQPNDVLTVREILERYTQGLPLTTGDVGFYDDPEGEDFSEFDAMDKFEKEMYIRENREYIKELEDRMKQDEENNSPNNQESGEADKPQKSDGHDVSDSDVEPPAKA